MACTDCFNGCSATTSDKCVKYTGVDVPELNILKGDPLYSVENNIILKILSMMVGDGILPEIPTEDYCAIIAVNLPPVGPYTLNDYISAITKALCNNTSAIQTIDEELQVLRADYDLNCLTGIGSQDVGNTHVILQAVLDYACQLQTQIDSLALMVTTNYVAVSDLDGYIEEYLTSVAPSNLISNKMIPYTAVEYYGTLDNFNASGAGIGDWAKVYLCNGANGTPDKRGRTPVGVTSVVGGGAYNPAVDPGITDNPNYVLNTPLGSNTVTLTAAQIAPHTHTATVVVTDPGHTHPNSTESTVNGSGSTYNYDSVGDKEHFGTISTQSATTGITVSVTNSSSGSGDAHSNIQPVLPCYYIMFIP